MKKIFVLMCILFFGIGVSGCQKKSEIVASQNNNTLLNGQSYILEIWAAKDVQMLEALAREYVSQAGERGLSSKVISFASEENMQEELLHALAEGGGPDVIYTNGQWVSQNNRKLFPAQNSPVFNAELFRSNFVRSATDLLIKEDTIWGIPIGIDTLAVFYNEDHLISSLKDRYEPGRTWDTFQEDVELLTKQNNSFERFSISGAPLGRSDNTLYMFDIFLNMYAQFGGELFSPDQSRAIFASQRGVTSDGQRRNFSEDSLQYLTSFADSRHKSYTWSEFMVNESDPEREYTAFAEGRVSMVFGYARDYRRVLDILDSGSGWGNRQNISKNNVRVAFLPQVFDPRKTSDRRVVARVDTLAVTRGSIYPQLAWNFLDFAIGQDNMRSYFDTTNVPSPRLDLIAEQESTPEIGIFARQAKFSESGPFPFDYNFVKDSFNEGISIINDRKASPKETLQAIEKKFNSLLTQNSTRMEEINRIYQSKHQKD